MQGDVYAVEPDNDGVWYHQVLDAHWGLGEEDEDVSHLFSNDVEYCLGHEDIDIVSFHYVSVW